MFECSDFGYLITEISSIEGSSECDCLWHTQDLLTVLEDVAGCCGCETKEGDFGELPLQYAKQLIICTRSAWTNQHAARHIDRILLNIIRLEVSI